MNFLGGQYGYAQPGVTNTYAVVGGNVVTGIIALVVFVVAAAINLYSGLWGAGYIPEAHCPTARTAMIIIWLIYILVGIALVYTLFTIPWPDQAYWFVIIASILSVLAVATRAWWARSEYSFLRLLSGPIVQFLLLAALFIILHQLWWTLYRPFDYDWLALIARNAVAFWMGWILFAAVKTLWWCIVYYFSWHSKNNKILLWVLELLAFGSVFFAVYNTHLINGVQSLWGFVIAALIVFIGCLLL